MSDQEVKLYVYDISRGMARQMSSLFLGKQIDGIWHTGVVCYGGEYFFGSAGIQCCIPGTLVLGEPDEIIDLGSTQIPEELFEEYLSDVGESQFRGDQYHLLDWNCNTFSNEVAVFLTGRPIPEKIQNLPKQFINTPLGAMLKPMIDSMSMRSPEGVAVSRHRKQPQKAEDIFEPRPPECTTKQLSTQSPESNAASSAVGSSKVPVHQAQGVVFDQHEIPDVISAVKDFNLEEQQQETLEIVNAMLIAETLDDFNNQHIQHLDEVLSLFSKIEDSDKVLEPFSYLLRVLSSYETPRKLFIKDEGSKMLMRFIHEARRSPSVPVHIASTQMLVNISSISAGRTSLLAGQGEVFEQREVLQLGISSVLADNLEQNECGLALLYNISLTPVVGEETALECITALVEFTKTSRPDHQVHRCLFALRNYMNCGSNEVSPLLRCLGLEISGFIGRTDEIDLICKDISTLMIS